MMSGQASKKVVINALVSDLPRVLSMNALKISSGNRNVQVCNRHGVQAKFIL